MKDKTVVIIAHRLSTIIRSDKIYVIGDGKVVEKGNHTTLLERNGVYKMLHDIQSEEYESNRKVLAEYEME